MAKNLVIVESPAKVKTIKKFLGKNYEVVASNGHVRDLPKSQMGIDVENNYEPKYITIRGKGDILANLRKEVKKADTLLVLGCNLKSSLTDTFLRYFEGSRLVLLNEEEHYADRKADLAIHGKPMDILNDLGI